MEANTYAWRTTPHSCTVGEGKYYSTCDRGGDSQEIWEKDQKAYGPGDSFKINTLKEFHVKQSFNSKEDKLDSIVTIMTQGESTYEFTV